MCMHQYINMSVFFTTELVNQRAGVPRSNNHKNKNEVSVILTNNQ